MRITFRHPDTGWREFNKQEYLCLYQDAYSVFNMFDQSKVSVIMEHEGMAVCSKAMLAEVKLKYSKSNSFAAMLDKVPKDVPLYKSMNIDVRSLT